MSWLEHHTQSKQCASLAEAANRKEGSQRTALPRQERVRECYRLAAATELQQSKSLNNGIEQDH